MNGLAEVEGDEVAGEVAVKGFDDAENRFAGVGECPGVAFVGDEQAFIGAAVLAFGGSHKCFSQRFDAHSLPGADQQGLGCCQRFYSFG